MSVIDEIKTRVDIVDLISETVPLKKAGRSFKAPCPFHMEKTPSFVVSPDRQSWHCFGACSTGGDIFGFVQKRDNVDFPAALRTLAERAGVELAPRDAAREERFERLYAANEAAATFYQSRLLQADDAADARAYLDRRGLDDATIHDFRIGYAPDAWDTLRTHLERRGFATAELLAAGLLIESDRGGYDRFRARVIFPINDERGRVVGFGGRELGNEGPKYLNTAQTDIFDKGGVIYALDRAKERVRTEDRAVIVEGYMDAIAAHQFGYTNVVASMGTALTERQVDLLKRHTHNLVLALDADAAGSEATLRGIQVVVDAADHELTAVPDWRGLIRYQDTLAADIRVVALPPGKDPDDAIRERPESWPELIATARPVLDHLLAVARDRFDLNQPRERSRAIDSLLPALAAVTDPLLRAHYVQRLAALARVEEGTLLTRLRMTGQPQRRRAPQNSARPGPAQDRTPKTDGPPAWMLRDRREEFILAMLQRHPSLDARGRALPPDTFRLAENRALFQSWLAGAQPEPDTPAASLAEQLTRVELPPYDALSADAAFEGALRLLHRERLLEMKRLTQSTVTEETEGADQESIIVHALAEREGREDESIGPDPASIFLKDIDTGLRLHARPVTPLPTGQRTPPALKDTREESEE